MHDAVGDGQQTAVRFGVQSGIKRYSKQYNVVHTGTCSANPAAGKLVLKRLTRVTVYGRLVTQWTRLKRLTIITRSAHGGRCRVFPSRARSMAMSERCMFTHLSHVYAQGSSAYTTYVFRCGRTTKKTLARWRKIKTAASKAIVANGGTISHQHGVGTDHAPYLEAEKPNWACRPSAVSDHFDPAHIMNPGKLLED